MLLRMSGVKGEKVPMEKGPADNTFQERKASGLKETLVPGHNRTTFPKNRGPTIIGTRRFVNREGLIFLGRAYIPREGSYS